MNKGNNKNKELLLEISYKCNSNCIHCSSISCEGMIKLKDIPKYLIDDINTVRISGGEPTYFLNSKELEEYVRFFKDREIKVILQTNGWTDDFITRNIDEIWISLYGDENYHNFIIRPENYKAPYYTNVINTIKNLSDRNDIVKIQSAVFSDSQYWNLLWTLSHDIGNFDINLRLFALLNHGRCNFAYPIEKQLEIINKYRKMYDNIEITCSLDDSKCNYENKLVLKPDGSLFNCASHKHGITLCKR